MSRFGRAAKPARAPQPAGGGRPEHRAADADGPPSPPAGTGASRGSGRRRDLATAAAAAVLVVAAAVVGVLIERAGQKLYVDFEPLYSEWAPHAGPGTVPALAVAVAVAGWGPAVAARLRWPALVAGAWAAAMAWTFSLALVDGWQRGIAGQLTDKHEYLLAMGRWDDAGAALRTFTDHILIDVPQNWPAHVAGHPPGAMLTFVGLDRIGLGGGAWAGVFCIVAGSSAAAAILVTLRALGAERAARLAAPFAVLAPAAVWIGTSADGYFAAVTAWGLALLALAGTSPGRARWAAALGAGLLLGWVLYLSYGLALAGILALAVVACTRTLRPLPVAAVGAAAVAAAFTAAGFWWLEGYELLVERYFQGVGGERPQYYWVWANLAIVVITAGPAAIAGRRRAVQAAPAALGGLRGGPPRGTDALAVLAAAALLAIAAADLSGMSKAETERIWLPFVVWVVPAAALLPVRDHRVWLGVQAALALLANHLLLNGW
ncbi:glycosyltransferase family 39 protein [Streptomonospora sediminis]